MNTMKAHRIPMHTLIAGLAASGHGALTTLTTGGFRLVFRNEDGAAALAVKAGNDRKEIASLPIDGGQFEYQNNTYLVQKSGDIGENATWKLFMLTPIPATISGKIPDMAALTNMAGGISKGNNAEQDQMAHLFSEYGTSPEDSEMPAAGNNLQQVLMDMMSKMPADGYSDDSDSDQSLTGTMQRISNTIPV